ncbi:hypothetical protein CF326_g1594 [Tilletia indica]|nr:hypothetical protein CF326_g1594 [Tilletia indica]
MDALSTPSKARASNSSSSSGSSGKKRKREEGTPKSNGASTAAVATPTKASSSSSSTTPTGRLPKQPRKDKKQADSKKKEAVSADDVGDVSVSSSVGSSKQQANGKQRKVRSRTFSDAAVPAATAVAATTPAISNAPQSAYRVVYPVLNMPIAPVWWKHPLGAVRELFDTMVMRYVPQLNGILIAHEEHTFLTGTAEIRSDSAFATVPVKVKCTIWAPSIGMRLEGKIVYSNTDVVSLLLNGTFNAAIPAAHLPPNQYEFVHNDYSGAADSQAVDGAEDEDFGAHSPGFWRRKRDKTQLGGSSGQLTFTCFGITVANQLLFLRGSLLDDPLSASQGGGDRSSTDPSSTSPSVDARALQTLFPNVNLDFSSKDGLESGARRSAVRGANANGSGEMGGAAAGLGEGGEGVRRRVRWYDQEEGEDGDDDDDEDEDEEGPQITFGGAAGSTSASASASTPAITKSAEKVGNDDDDDYEMIDLTTTTTSAPTISKAADADAEVDVKPKHKHKSKSSKSSSAVDAPAPAPPAEEGREETDAERKERKRERKRLKQEKNAEKARRRAEREVRRAEKEAKRSEKAAKHAAVKKEAAGI